MRRIGIFGGTFDPVHLGHLGPALQALSTFAFDELVFVPAGDPPHKQGEPLTSFAHRFAMLALATAGYDRLFVSDIERRRPGPTYTIDTLRLLRERHPGDRLYFLMGSDSFAQITTWHRWEELVELADLVVLHRLTAWGEELAARTPERLRSRMATVAPGAGGRASDSAGACVHLLDHEPYPVSSTQLREMIRRGRPVAELLPAEVYRYIVKYHLYQDGGEPTDGC
jgi:nicotinate-nucleotide adenylyltransferase